MIARERRRLHVRGVVQGVGFRPFVYRLAERHGLAGYVLNDGAGVVVEAEGAPDALDALELALREEAPELARVDDVLAESLAPCGESGFEIALSVPVGATALVALVPTLSRTIRSVPRPAAWPRLEDDSTVRGTAEVNEAEPACV